MLCGVGRVSIVIAVDLSRVVAVAGHTSQRDGDAAADNERFRPHRIHQVPPQPYLSR
jgi:hypothetical protein